MSYSLSTDDNLSKNEIEEQILFSDKLSVFYAGRSTHLKRKRNEIILSGKLTDDILLRIFVMLSHDPERIVDRWNWIAIVHVCHRWRMIGLECGEVWSNIVIRTDSSLRRAREMLKRSKQSDLFLSFLQDESSDISIYDVKQILNYHSAKIKNLSIAVSGETWDNIAESIGPSLHMLEVLDVRLKTRTRSDNWDPVNLYLVGSLKRLSFTNPLLDTTTFHNVSQMNNLRNLAFQKISLRSSELPHLLQHCPQLEQLSLHGCTTEDPNWPSYKVALMKLGKLSFHKMEIEEISSHIGYMELPIKLDLIIDGIGSLFSWVYFDFDLGDFFKEEYNYKSFQFIISEEETILEAAIYEATGSRDETCISYIKRSLLIRGSFGPIDSGFSLKMDEMILGSGVKNVTDIYIKINVNDYDSALEGSEYVWAEFFWSLQSVVSLSIEFTGHDLSLNLQAEDIIIKSLRHNLCDSSCRITFCPSLEDISLRYFQFSEASILELEHTLRLRERYNAPIKKLRLCEAIGLSTTDRISYIEDLFRHVQVFEWSRIDPNKEKIIFKGTGM